MNIDYKSDADVLLELDQALLECSKGIIFDKNVFYPGTEFTPEQKAELKLEWLKALGVWPLKTIEQRDKELEDCRMMLKALLELKDHKDLYGKTDEYLKNQPLTWDIVRKYLAKLSI